MGNQTRKHFQNYLVKRAYFCYWRLQNNPNYIDFYKKIKGKQARDLREVFFYDPPLLEGEKDGDHRGLKKKWGWHRYAEEKFKLGPFSVINPFKKIDWANFPKIQNPDQDIILALEYSRMFRPAFPSAFLFAPTEEENRNHHLGPIVKFDIDIRCDNREIWGFLLKQIDLERASRGINCLNRDHLNKFHLYAQVWDLRKGQNRKPFREIARMGGVNISTTKSRFYKAFELIFGQAFDNDLFKKLKGPVYKESLAKYCENCSDRETCKDICPDVMSFVMQDWKERDYREVQAFENNPKIKAHLGLNK